MKTVWKFPLAVRDVQEIHLPRGAEILTVQPQGEGVCLWALVESEAVTDPRCICIVGTGHQVPGHRRLEHISTFQLHGGALVFHAFESL